MPSCVRLCPSCPWQPPAVGLCFLFSVLRLLLFVRPATIAVKRRASSCFLAAGAGAVDSGITNTVERHTYILHTHTQAHTERERGVSRGTSAYSASCDYVESLVLGLLGATLGQQFLIDLLQLELAEKAERECVCNECMQF